MRPESEPTEHRIPLDVDGAEATDGFLPTLPESARAAGGRLPVSGDRLGDFFLLHELGRGSFARVFLARQGSLDRLVALKVSANSSHEARTLARLDHPHIVQVLDEWRDQDRDLRLLYMRYVPGTTLQHVLRDLVEVPFPRRSGRVLLEAIARLSTPDADPGAAAAEPSPLERDDFVEAVCWLGARLAEALAFAHARDVLHRDIKPANVLLDRQGRPFLADFNLAFDPRRDASAGERFGGTLPYMAPEHRDAFEGRAAPGVVAACSDVYALGIILFELLTGVRPSSEERITQAPAPARLEPALPGVLDRVVRRCLEPDPRRRYQKAAELALALDGCRQWQRTQRDLPRAGPLVRAASRHPVLVALTLPSLPQLVGAAVVIAYNTQWLAAHPDAARWTSLFVWLVLGCTGAALVLAYWATWRVGAALWRTWRPLQQAADVDAGTVVERRRRALLYPQSVLVLSLLGWMPGSVVVPATLAAVAGPAVGLQVLLSFVVAGLMALTYSVYGVMFLVLRVGYPNMWGDARGMWQTASSELAGVDRQLTTLQVLSVLIPLTAGLALLAGRLDATPEAVGAPSYRVFQVLLLSLIGLGIVAIGATAWIHGYLRRTLAALTGVRATSRFEVRHGVS